MAEPGTWAQLADKQAADRELELGKYRYQRYLQAREHLGYHPEGAMLQSVWLGCDASSQQSMLRQMEDAAFHAVEARERLAKAGLEWGMF